MTTVQELIESWRHQVDDLTDENYHSEADLLSKCASELEELDDKTYKDVSRAVRAGVDASLPAYVAGCIEQIQGDIDMLQRHERGMFDSGKIAGLTHAIALLKGEA